MAEVLRGRFAGIDLDKLVNYPSSASGSTGDVLAAVHADFRRDDIGLFNYPDYLGATSSTFGRLRPVHVNGVIFGAFSTLFFGLCYYLVPRLCGIRVPWRMGRWPGPGTSPWPGPALPAVRLNHGLEAGELPFLADLAILIVLA